MESSLSVKPDLRNMCLKLKFLEHGIFWQYRRHWDGLLVMVNRLTLVHVSELMHHMLLF